MPRKPRRHEVIDPGDDDAPSVRLDLAAMPELVELARRLRVLQRELIDAGEREWADRLDRILTQWEMTK